MNVAHFFFGRGGWICGCMCVGGRFAGFDWVIIVVQDVMDNV